VAKKTTKIAKAISKAILDHEHEIHVFVGCGYVIDKKALQSVVKEALEEIGL